MAAIQTPSITIGHSNENSSNDNNVHKNHVSPLIIVDNNVVDINVEDDGSPLSSSDHFHSIKLSNDNNNLMLQQNQHQANVDPQSQQQQYQWLSSPPQVSAPRLLPKLPPPATTTTTSVSELISNSTNQRLTLSQCFNPLLSSSSPSNGSLLSDDSAINNGRFISDGLSSSSSSPSSSSSSPPSVVQSSSGSTFQAELSELGISLAKLALHAEGVPLIICDDYLPISVANCSSKSLKYQHSNGGGAGISGSQSRNNGLQPGSLRRRSYRVLHPPPQPLLPSPAQFYFHHLAAVAAAAHAAEAEQQQIRNNFTSSYRNLAYHHQNNNVMGNNGHYINQQQQQQEFLQSNNNDDNSLSSINGHHGSTLTTTSAATTATKSSSMTNSSAYFFHHHHHYHYHHHVNPQSVQSQSLTSRLNNVMIEDDISIINNNNIINNGNLNNRNQSCSSCLNTTTANVADDDEQSTFRDENEFSFQEDGKMVSLLDLYKHQEQTMSRVNFVKGDDLIRYPSSISNGYQQPPNNSHMIARNYVHRNMNSHHQQQQNLNSFEESHYQTVISNCTTTETTMFNQQQQQLSSLIMSTSPSSTSSSSSSSSVMKNFDPEQLALVDSILEESNTSCSEDIENHLESSFIESGSSSSSCSLSTDLTASSSYCSSSFFNQESDIVDCLTGNDNMKKIGNGNVDRIVLNDNSQHLTLQSQCSDSASTISSTSSSSSNSHDHNTMMANINIDHQSKRLSVPRMLKPRKRRRKTNAMMAATAESFVAKQSSTITNSSSMLFDLDDYHNQYCSYKTDVDKQNVPDMQPPTRPWLTMAEPTPIHHVSNVFTVMCYNVLCDKLASRQLYSYCPSWALSWDFRKNVIMKEIKQYDADIICLQEVESGQFESFFLPELKISHYYGIFSPKSRAKTMNEQERKRVDGCAIFFKTEKFELVNEHLMEFTFLAAQTADGEGSEEMLNRVMPKDNIGLVALLKTRKVEIDVSEKSSEFENMQPFESQPLVVCTAHIHWDPEYCDVKLIQTMLMMRELQKFIDQSATMFNLSTNTEKQVDPNSIPLIICGDFNSLPDSGVVEYLSRGRISVEHPDFKKLAYKLCLRKVCPVVDQNEKEYTHPFDIVKAYADGVLPFTNYTFDFRGVIDYIFCSQRLFSVLGVLGPLDTKWFSKHRIPGCPHHYIPSDHFPIVAELELLTKKSMAELEKQKQQQEKNNLENKSGNKNNNSGNNSNGHVRR